VAKGRKEERKEGKKEPIAKKGWRVAQGIGPEFKPQYLKENIVLFASALNMYRLS
jgi:hypothetical protein